MENKNAIHAEVEVLSEGGEQNDIALPNQILPKQLKSVSGPCIWPLKGVAKNSETFNKNN